jgi:hypothetical protein
MLTSADKDSFSCVEPSTHIDNAYARIAKRRDGEISDGYMGTRKDVS